MGKHKKSSKKHKKEKKHKSKRKSSSDESSEDEWVEKPSYEETITSKDIETKPKREDWLDMSQIILTSSTSDRRKERELEKSKRKQEEQYNPSKCSRELNPYWKDGGTGLPTFKKPSESLNYDEGNYKNKKSNNWRTTEREKVTNEIKIKEDIPEVLDPNVIASKLIKAEMMGNTKLVEELKKKLEYAKQNKLNETESDNDVMLTQTDSRGYSRPLTINEDNYGNKKKKQKVDTYRNKERTSYYPDDDKYSLKEMFEAEKYNTIDDANKEFAKIAAGISKNDNLEDLFVDKIRNKASTSKDIDTAIDQHHKITKSLDNCSKCIQSENSLKHLIIQHKEYCYLSLPNFEPLTDGHCLIIPIRHVSCTVQLDENEWEEIDNIRKDLMKLFKNLNKSLIFFETAKSFNKYPHMVIECVPIPIKNYDLAQIYFKKAIDESETEWSHNKKLILLKNKNVRKAVPKGLPYFFVDFGINEGFAHVIEDQNMFPNNFAQEIIGGMLDIHHSKWRRPQKESFDKQQSRVLEFKKLLKQ